MNRPASPEAWLRDRLWAGPRAAYVLRKGAALWNYSHKQVNTAAENIDAIVLRDQRGSIYWRLPPATRLDALRVLDRDKAGHFNRFRPDARDRIVAEAAAVAGLGRCYDCEQILPLAELFEDAAGLTCDPCSMAS